MSELTSGMCAGNFSELMIAFAPSCCFYPFYCIACCCIVHARRNDASRRRTFCCGCRKAHKRRRAPNEGSLRVKVSRKCTATCSRTWVWSSRATAWKVQECDDFSLSTFLNLLLVTSGSPTPNKVVIHRTARSTLLPSVQREATL